MPGGNKSENVDLGIPAMCNLLRDHQDRTGITQVEPEPQTAKASAPKSGLLLSAPCPVSSRPTLWTQDFPGWGWEGYGI